MYVIQTGLETNKYDNNYYIKSPRGVIVLSSLQYTILQEFVNSRTIKEIIEKYKEIDSVKLEKLLNKFVFEKLIIEPDLSVLKKKTIGYYFRVFTKFKMPSKQLAFIVNNVICKINLKFAVTLSVLFVIISVFINIKLIKYTDFSWNNVPRIFIFFIIGIVVSFFHELWLARFITTYAGGDKLRFKIRFLLGVFISIVVDWQFLLCLKRKKIVQTFLLVDFITAGLCGFFSIISYFFMLFKQKEMAYIFCSFSIIGYSYMVLNLYPFLFKSDGYNIFCMVTDTSRLRHYFFKMFVSFFRREKIDYIRKNKLWVYLLWGSMFVLTLLFIEYALQKGIRLRI